jgi:hypothetical protein
MVANEELDSESDEYKLLEKELEFLNEMRMLHEEAILDDRYLRDCYDDYYQLLNNGGLCLVSWKYFQFGSELLKVVESAVTQKTIQKEGDDFWQLGLERVDAEKRRLLALFLQCGTSAALETDKKKEMFDFLVQKTLNARFGRETTAYKNHNTRRHGTYCEDQAFRPQMKSIGKNSLVKEETKSAASAAASAATN